MSRLKLHCFLALVLLSIHQISSTTALFVQDNSFVPFRTGSEYLDPQSKYFLSWSIEQEKKTISFEVTAETTGYVGFGISPKGGMTGADILIAGVHSNGTVYYKDYHSSNNSRPIEDTNSNWVVTSVKENETHTTLVFSRLLNTCDEDDLEITDGTARLIYALGETDNVAYHNANRGTKSVNFYLPDEHEFDPSKYENLTITKTMVMPPQDTTYWCTMHKTPRFPGKQHVVSFQPVLESLPALQHTHHFILFRCTAPKGQNPQLLFEPWLSFEGDFCYDPKNSSFPFLQYCSATQLYDWSKGGKQLVFPPEMGLPMPDNFESQPEDYYVLEIHYDNPQMLENVEFETGVRVYYTSQLRDIDVGLMLVNHDYQAQLLIPPKVEDYVITGHCSKECTEAMFPKDGITIFNNLFHAHLAGRKLKFRHFRGQQELSWIDVDEYYDFDFQQNKPLTKTRKVLRGDQLTVECNMDTTKAQGGKAVIGGLGSREEMCEAIFYYYPKIPIFSCGSMQNITDHMRLLGVTDFKRKEEEHSGGMPEYDILAPQNLAGDYLDSVSFKVKWTTQFLEKFQQEKRYGVQISTCFGVDAEYSFPVSYPENIVDYVPPNECVYSGGNVLRLDFVKFSTVIGVMVIKMLL